MNDFSRLQQELQKIIHYFEITQTKDSQEFIEALKAINKYLCAMDILISSQS